MNIEHYKSYWGKNILPERLYKILDYANPGMNLLDFGCGQGSYCKRLNENGYKTIGVDINQYDEWQNDSNFIQIDSSHIPFKENTFDLSFSFEVLEHCQDYKTIISELKRVTINHLILSVPNCDLNNPLRTANLVPAHWTDRTHCNFFTKESIREILYEFNFKNISISDCLPISVSDYYWKTLKVPAIFKKLGAKICEI